MWVIIGLCVVLFVVFLSASGKAAQLKAAKEAYDAALAALRGQPHDAQARQACLQAGRNYAALTRNSAGTTVFDEVALMNDMNAATGGTPAPALASNQSGARQESVQERLTTIARLKEKGLLSEQEYAEKRASILRDI